MSVEMLKNKRGLCQEEIPIKLGVLVSHPIQYFVSVYQAIDKFSNVDLTVLYRTRMGLDSYYDAQFGTVLKWDIPLLDDYKSHFLSSKSTLFGIEFSVIKALFHNRFDVLIIYGYNSYTNMLAICVAKLLGIHLILRGDSRLEQRTGVKSRIKKWAKIILFKQFDAFLTIGHCNREYYKAYGVERKKIFFSPFSVNNVLFSVNNVERLHRRMTYRREINVPEDGLVILFASKFTQRKRASDLIEAYAKLVCFMPNVWLVMAGSGEQEQVLKKMSNQLNLNQIRFLGFQNQTQLPDLYAASDCFVLPSEAEPWGLIVNEVMAAGLPVIISDDVGCAVDLVEGKGTGLVYPCGNIDALIESLQHVLNSVELRQAMSRNALHLIQSWGPDTSALYTVNTVKHVLKMSCPLL